MVGPLAERTDHHVLSDRQRGDVVVGIGVGLVERHEQEAVVGARPLRVAVDVLRQPAVALGDRAVVHVVAEVGDEERHRGQRRVVRRHGRQRQVRRGRDVTEVRPRTVLACVVPAHAPGVARLGEVLGVPGEGETGRKELAAEAGGVECERAPVVVDALGVTREQREVVRLARVRLGVHVGQRRARRGQRREVRRLPDDVLLVLVLQHHDHDVIRSARLRRRRSCRRLGARGRHGRCGRGGGSLRAPERRAHGADHQTGEHGSRSTTHLSDAPSVSARPSMTGVSLVLPEHSPPS